MKQVDVKDGVPEAKYSLFGEKIRQTIPGPMQCSMACGGRRCKWENPAVWSDSEQCIKGVYSTWVLEDVVAMARPSTSTIEKYNMVQQFKDNNIRSIINLQTPGEHSSCGPPLEKESLFTYKPQIFMENEIYFYNFGWKDYGVTSLATLLDMVKVMTFAVDYGKVAVHCHAGLGRTGVLIACYLVYAHRMQPSAAILRIRAKRANSIQTRGQIACIHDFANYLRPLQVVFSQVVPHSRPPTLQEFLVRQRHLLHGTERRELRHIPKLVQVVCQRLLHFAQSKKNTSSGSDENDDPLYIRRCNTVAAIIESSPCDGSIPQITLSQMNSCDETDVINETDSVISSLHSTSSMSIAALGPSIPYKSSNSPTKSLCRSVNDLRELHKAAQDTKVALFCARGWTSDQSLYPEAQSIKVRSLVISQESLTDTLANDLPHSRCTVREFLSANARDRKPPTNENNNNVLRESTNIESITSSQIDADHDMMFDSKANCSIEKKLDVLESSPATNEPAYSNIKWLKSHDCESSILIIDNNDNKNDTLFESHLHHSTSNADREDEMKVVELEEPNSEFEEEDPVVHTNNSSSNVQTSPQQTAAFVKILADNEQMLSGRGTPLMYRAEKNLQLLDCDDDASDDDESVTQVIVTVKDNSLPPNTFRQSDKEVVLRSPTNGNKISKCSSLVFDPLPEVVRSRSMNDLSSITYPPDLSSLQPNKLQQPPAEYIAQALKRDEITCTDVAQAMAYKLTDDEWLWEKVYTRQVEINTSPHGWSNLCLDTDAYAISALMWSWLEHLAQPVLSETSANQLLDILNQPKSDEAFHKTFEKALQTLDLYCTKTINCLLKCVVSFENVTDSVLELLVRRLIAALTHQVQCLDTTDSSTWSNKLIQVFLRYVHDTMDP